MSLQQDIARGRGMVDELFQGWGGQGGTANAILSSTGEHTILGWMGHLFHGLASVVAWQQAVCALSVYTYWHLQPALLQNHAQHAHTHTPDCPDRALLCVCYCCNYSCPPDYLSQAAKSFNNIEEGFYISPAFLDKLTIHVAKNFMDLPKIKVPLILGIWGGKGQVSN